jgi:hypothetical protein
LALSSVRFFCSDEVTMTTSSSNLNVNLKTEWDEKPEGAEVDNNPPAWDEMRNEPAKMGLETWKNVEKILKLNEADTKLVGEKAKWCPGCNRCDPKEVLTCNKYLPGMKTTCEAKVCAKCRYTHREWHAMVEKKLEEKYDVNVRDDGGSFWETMMWMDRPR